MTTNIGAILEAQISLIEDAIEKAYRNEIVDIEPIGTAVDEICRQIRTLDGETVREIQPRMLTMVSYLDQFSEAVSAYHERMKKRLEKSHNPSGGTRHGTD
jgi:hypothetical protein